MQAVGTRRNMIFEFRRLHLRVKNSLIVGDKVIRNFKLGTQVAIIIILLYLIRILRVPPGIISGNGNPVLLVIIPLIVILFFFGMSWFKWLRDLQLSRGLRALVLSFSILVLAYGITETVQDISGLKAVYTENFEKRYGRPVDSEYLQQVSSGVNIHTNYLYFNYATFLALASILNIIAVSSSFIKPIKTVVQCLDEGEQALESNSSQEK